MRRWNGESGDWRLVRAIAALAVAAAATTGCGGEDPAQSTDASEDLAQELLSSTSEEQREALADLEVSEEEYVEAYDRLRACLREHGWSHAAVERHANGISFVVGVDAPDSQLGEFESDLAECQHKLVLDIEQVYFAQQVVPEAEYPRLKQELVDCLEQNGIAGATTEMTDGQIANLLYEENAPVTAWVCRETFLFKTGEAAPSRAAEGAGP
jgi:hypothetical protein